jgi:hypothetical protein
MRAKDKSDAIYNHFARVGLIASYPRSGSALVRATLYQLYGRETGSIYDESERSDTFREFVGDVGDVVRDGVFYKTHDRAKQPIGHPVVVVVRDPRDVLMSLQRFYADGNNLDFCAEELIMGQHPWGDWSEWIKSWVRYAPDPTLWVRYERFDGLELADYFRLQLTAEWRNLRHSLGGLRDCDPLMFGPGQYTSQQRADWFGDHYELFLARHSHCMTMLGYYQ